MPYIQVKLRISPAQQKKLIKGRQVRLTADDITKGSDLVLLHPLNAKKLANSNRGVNLMLSPGEVIQTAILNKAIPFKISDASEMTGEGFFNDLWSGIKKAGKFLKDSGVLTTLADASVAPISAFTGNPGATIAGREILRQTTGVGVKSSKRGQGLYTSTRGSGLYI